MVPLRVRGSNPLLDARFLAGRRHYIEIKGYVTVQTEAKFEFFYRPLRVFRLADLRPMFDYVRERYGRNLLALYEYNDAE
jgi:hypothetical protein